MNWQLFVAFGLFLGFSANLAVFDVKILHWRLQLASAALPAIPLLVLIFVCPGESCGAMAERESNVLMSWFVQNRQDF